MKKISLIAPILTSVVGLSTTVGIVSCNKSPKEEEAINISVYGSDSRLGEECIFTGGLNKDTVITFNKIVEGYQLVKTSLVVKHGDTNFIVGEKDDPAAEVYINEDGKSITIKALYMVYTDIKIKASAEEITTEIESKAKFLEAYTNARKGFDEIKNEINYYTADGWTFMPQKVKNDSQASGGFKIKGDEGKEYAFVDSYYFDFINNKIGGEDPADVSTRVDELEKNYYITYKEGKYSIRYIATLKDTVEADIKKMEVVYDKSTSMLLGIGKYDTSKTGDEQNYWLDNFIYSKKII